MQIETISAKRLPELLGNAEATVIDVRTPKEYESAHVVGAQLFPLDKLSTEHFCQQHGKDSPVYILCQSGKRAAMAAERLMKEGHGNVAIIEGGTEEAINAGIHVEYGKSSISIERQVRIVAGLLVLTGTLAGAFIDPGLLLIPGVVGAGLAFAGITDTCGIAMALGKCPWNQ
jgi:rhodanese-related sulfurtransferase